MSAYAQYHQQAKARDRLDNLTAVEAYADNRDGIYLERVNFTDTVFARMSTQSQADFDNGMAYMFNQATDEMDLTFDIPNVIHALKEPLRASAPFQD